MLGIRGPRGVEDLSADFVAVEVEFVIPEPGNIGPRAKGRCREVKFSAQFVRAANPLRLPVFAMEQARFESRRGAVVGGVPLLVPPAYLPKISVAAFERAEVLATYANAQDGMADIAANPKLRPSLERLARYGHNLFLMRGSATSTPIGFVKYSVRRSAGGAGPSALVAGCASAMVTKVRKSVQRAMRPGMSMGDLRLATREAGILIRRLTEKDLSICCSG